MNDSDKSQPPENQSNTNSDSSLSDLEKLKEMVSKSAYKSLMEHIPGQLSKLESVLSKYKNGLNDELSSTSKSMSDFKSYTKYLDSSLKKFKTNAEGFAEAITEMTSLTTFEDSDPTQEDIDKLKSHFNDLENILRNLIRLHEDIRRTQPPSGCGNVQYQFKLIIERFLNLADNCIRLMRKFSDDPLQAFETEEQIQMGDDGIIYFQFGDHNFSFDPVINEYKQVYNRKRESMGNQFNQALISGAIDLFVLDMFIDF